MYLAPVDVDPAPFVDGFVAVTEAVVADHTGGAAGKVAAVVVDMAVVVGKTVVVGKVVAGDRAVAGKTVAVVVVVEVVVDAVGKVVVDDKAAAVVDRVVVVVDKAVAVAERAVVVDKVVVVVDRIVDDKVVAVDNLGLVVVDKAVADDEVVAVGNLSLVAVGNLGLVVVVGRAVAVDIAVGMVAADHTEQARVVVDPGREVVEGVVLDHSVNKMECMFEHSYTSTKGDLVKGNT